jgi:hypothetical protein
MRASPPSTGLSADFSPALRYSPANEALLEMFLADAPTAIDRYQVTCTFDQYILSAASRELMTH